MAFFSGGTDLAKYHRRPKSTHAVGGQPPDAELDVLAYIWRFRQATAREIRDALHAYRPMTHSSVLTLLKRLAARGLVARNKAQAGKAFVYRPTRRARPAYQRILRNMAERIFGGNSLEMFSSMFGAKLPTQDELERLQEILNELRSKRRKRRK